jgi:hypothetical protein
MVNGRNKGKNGERQVIALLQPIVAQEYGRFGLPAPVLERNLEQTRGGGYDIKGVPWLALEVKRVENLQVAAWWRQAIRQAGPEQVPALLYRRNQEKWTGVVFLWDAYGGRHTAQLDQVDWINWFQINLRGYLRDQMEGDSNGG